MCDRLVRSFVELAYGSTQRWVRFYEYAPGKLIYALYGREVEAGYWFINIRTGYNCSYGTL